MPQQEGPVSLRQQIEEAVEQLRYSVIDTVASMADDGWLEVGHRDVVDVDRLNSELERIFTPALGLFKCAGKYCPGLPYRPRDQRHPQSCVDGFRRGGRSAEGVTTERDGVPPVEEILPPPAVERASLDLLVRDLGARAKALRSRDDEVLRLKRDDEVLRLKRELALLKDRVAYLEAQL